MVTNAIEKLESEQGESASVPIPAQANPKKKGKLWLLLGMMVLLFGLGAGYFFVIRSSSEIPSKPAPRSAIARGKLTKPTPETLKAQAQLIDSTSAGVNKTAAEQVRKDSTIALQKPIIENKIAKETKKAEAQKGHQINEETKEIKEPKFVNDNKENNLPVKEESFADTLRRASPEIIGEMETSIPSLGNETENESPMIGKWVKDDSLKGQRASVGKTPSKELALAPELDSEREYFRMVLKVEEKSDSRAQVYYEKAVSYHQKQKFDQAIAFYKKALALDPGYQQARIKLASVLMQTGRFEEAKALLASLNALNPQDQKILFNLGLVSYKLGQYSDAQDKIQQLLNINPLHLEACLLLASIYEEKGEMNKAVELYGQAHSIDINDPAAIYNLARTLDLSGDKVKAAKYYQLYLTGNLEKDDELELAVRKRLNFLLLQLGEK